MSIVFSFLDQLAFLYAHELHHFRRYHLRMHRGEGEQSANRWALNYVISLGFRVTGSRNSQPKKKSAFKRFISKKFDPYKKFRHIPVGTKLMIHYDPKGMYEREIVAVLRPIRSNSRRVVVQTSDGRSWRWPMDWLTILS